MAAEESGPHEKLEGFRVWTSDLVLSKPEVGLEQIYALPDEVYLDEIQSSWGESRVTCAWFGLYSTSYRSVLDGYQYEVFLDKTDATKWEKDCNTRVKVVSIYLVGPGSGVVLKWGRYIDPSSGELFNPTPTEDPFAGEPVPKRFLGSN